MNKRIEEIRKAPSARGSSDSNRPYDGGGDLRCHRRCLDDGDHALIYVHLHRGDAHVLMHVHHHHGGAHVLTHDHRHRGGVHARSRVHHRHDDVDGLRDEAHVKHLY